MKPYIYVEIENKYTYRLYNNGFHDWIGFFDAAFVEIALLMIQRLRLEGVVYVTTSLHGKILIDSSCVKITRFGLGGQLIVVYQENELYELYNKYIVDAFSYGILECVYRRGSYLIGIDKLVVHVGCEDEYWCNRGPEILN